MKHATYIGPLEHLKGKGALIHRATRDGYVVAQFDDLKLTRSGGPMPPGAGHHEPPSDALGYGWHAFPAEHFNKVDEPAAEDEFYDDHSPFKSITRRL